MPGIASIARTRGISVVPGFAKHTSTPAAIAVRMRLSAPFILPPRYDLIKSVGEPLRSSRLIPAQSYREVAKCTKESRRSYWLRLVLCQRQDLEDAGLPAIMTTDIARTETECCVTP